MLKALVLLSDAPQLGKGMRGLLLYDFLRTYFSADEVRAITLDELDRADRMDVELLLIGVPTTLDKRRIRPIRFRQAVLFDYHDHEALRWGSSDRKFLATLSDLYLRCYTTGSARRDGWRIGLLPLYRKPKLKHCIGARQFWTGTLGRRITPIHDISFLGAPTEIRVEEDGREGPYNQRIEWLREVMSPSCPLSFWGGLTFSRETQRCLPELERRFGDLKGLVRAGHRSDFIRYFYNLCRSRVALAPAGYSRWSFRHYEAIYAGTAVLSTEMRGVELLVPLPLDNMFLVPDRASVLPAVQKAFACHVAEPERFEANIRFLEKYFYHGRYSRNRPLLLERFMSQFSDSAGRAAA